MVRVTKRNLGAAMAAGACAAVTATAAVSAAAAGASAKPVGFYTTKGAYSFVSAPKLHPPILKPDIKVVSRRLAPGYWFLTNAKAGAYTGPMVGEGGPQILDRSLQPVWSVPIGTRVVASNLKLQSYNGQPALSWWEGLISPFGVVEKGELFVVDQTYRTVAKLVATKPWLISLHDAVIQGTNVWVTVYRTIKGQNLKPYGGSSKGTLLDAGFQEYDLKTGKLLSTWDAMSHIKLSDSYSPPIKNQAWDAYHINSLQLVGSGEMLVSMRNTQAGYLVNLATGKNVWILGGKHSSFTPKTPFHFQHDIELHGSNLVSVFDDNCCNQIAADKFAPEFGPAHGLVLKLDFTHHSVSQVAQYSHGNLQVAFLGNTELLPDHNVVVGWGSRPYFSEFTKQGKMVFDVKWPSFNQSYRAYVERWVGKPYYPPSGAVKKKGKKATVYASWNGATQVASWEVMAGGGTSTMKQVAKATKKGFETVIPLKTSYTVYKVVALDQNKKVLGTSAVFPSSTGPGGGFYP